MTKPQAFSLTGKKLHVTHENHSVFGGVGAAYARSSIYSENH
jgi:transketolase C-terminal domain/subunit